MQFVITTHDDCTLTDASNIRTMLATYEPLTPMIVIGPLPNRIAKAVYESVWGYRNTWWAVGSVCIDIGLLDRSNPIQNFGLQRQNMMPDLFDIISSLAVRRLGNQIGRSLTDWHPC